MSTEEVAQSLSPEIQEKLGIAKQKKEEADQAFKAGDIKKGMRLLHDNACLVPELWVAYN